MNKETNVVYTNRNAFSDLKLNGPKLKGLDKLISFTSKRKPEKLHFNGLPAKNSPNFVEAVDLVEDV